MKRIQTILGSLLTLALLFGVGWLLIGVLQNQTDADTAQQPTAMPEVPRSIPPPLPTATPSLTWETATLEQIQFGEPQVMLTDTHSLRIVEWVSDEELLILRGLTSNRSKEAVEILNVKTRSARSFGERSGDGKPVWLPQQQTVAFVNTDFDTKKFTFSLSKGPGQAKQQEELELFPYMTASPDGSTLLAFESKGWPPNPD